MSYILEALKRSDLHRELVCGSAPEAGERPRVLQLRGPAVSRLAPVVMALAAVGGAAMLTLRSRENMPLPVAQGPAPATLAAAAEKAPALASPTTAAPAALPAETAAQPSGTAAAPSPADGPAPLFADLPLAYRQSVPFLHLDVHAWSASPGKRFVMLNGHIYREGDAAREGPVVERIEPGGVVLSYRGRRYKLLR